MTQYEHASSPLFELAKPQPLKQLEHGPKHKTDWHTLSAVRIDESTIDGNAEVIEEYIEKLLGFNDKTGRAFIRDILIPWLGDCMTIARARTLHEQLSDKENSYDRHEWQVLIIALFHMLMTFAKSLYEQYKCTDTGIGLAQAINKLLNRRHLATMSTKGTFYHHLDELLHHVGIAQFECAWLTVVGVDDLAELRQRRPDELIALAERIRVDLASTRAVFNHDKLPEERQDQYFRQSLHFNRDLLDYYIFDNAIKVGDIGVIEAMFPRLLFRFVGASNHNYTNEVLELLQGLNKEWPEELR